MSIEFYRAELMGGTVLQRERLHPGEFRKASAHFPLERQEANKPGIGIRVLEDQESVRYFYVEGDEIFSQVITGNQINIWDFSSIEKTDTDLERRKVRFIQDNPRAQSGFFHLVKDIFQQGKKTLVHS